MKKYVLAACLSTATSLSFACTFKWDLYGPIPVYDRVKEKIGSVVTEEWCNKYNKNYSIVIIADTYTTNTRSLAHVMVGLRLRGTNDLPVKRYGGYRFNDGNFVIGHGYDLATKLAIESVQDVMSSLSEYVPEK